MEPDSKPDESQELLKDLPFIGNHPIPPVDPTDMKALWQQGRDAEAQAKIDAEGGKPAVMMIMSREAAACSPAADLTSVIFRLWMMNTVHLFTPLSQLMPNETPSDVLFNAFAKIPMTALMPDKSNWPPYDPAELLKLITPES
jgi:hypothetical protein